MRKLINRRLPVQQSMPPLAEACADFKGFKPGEKRVDRVFDLLLVVIQRCRGPVAKRFYSMREVAAFFGASLYTAETVYHRLTAEGALIRIRSSQTMIPARAPRPRFAVRGVVCMPVWTPGFLQFLDWRRWFSWLEEELSRHRFVSEPVFYKLDEETHPDFVDRVLKFNPDCILWHNPSTADLTTMHSFADTGVPLIGVVDSPEEFPGRIYRQSRDRALRQGLKAWEESGEVDRIVIPFRNPDIPGMLERSAVLASCSLPHRYKMFSSEQKSSLTDFVRRLASSPRAGIIFYDDLFYVRICVKLPELILQLMRKHRVMVLHEVLMPLTAVPDLAVDALLFPWKKLARRIAEDLNQAKGSIPSAQGAFEAEWHSRLPLKKVVQFDFME